MHALIQSWLDIQCTMTTGVTSALVMMLAPNGRGLVQAAAWPRGKRGAPGLTALAELAIRDEKVTRHEPVNDADAQPLHLVSQPIRRNGRVVGALAAAVRADKARLPLRTAEKLVQGAAWIEALMEARSGGNSIDPAAQVLDCLATVLAQEPFRRAAAALANEMTRVVRCDRAAIGFLEKGYIRVRAVSHAGGTRPDERMMRHLASAMEESMEQAALLVYPRREGERPRILQAHRALARKHHNASVCSVPLARDGQVFGVMTLERIEPTPFLPDELAALEHIAALVGPVLKLQHGRDRPLRERIRERLAAFAERLRRPGSLGLKAGLAAGALILAGLTLVPVETHVAAPARLEGSVQRVIVAPAEGYLKEATVRPGDAVQAGQVLAELAGEDLGLQRQKWESDIAQAENAFGEALARHDRAQIAIHSQRVAEARAQLGLTEQQLERAQIRAPFDGVIIKGDLRQSLGAPVKRGEVLLTLAPSGEHRVVLEVDERDIAAIASGQRGWLMLAASPGAPLAIQVNRITPVAASGDGRNYFEVEARPAEHVPGLRPGMNGVARIRVADQALLARWADWLASRLRLAMWRWLG